MLNISKQKIDELLAERNLYSLKILKTPALNINLAKVLVVISLIFFISLFLPWQQNIRGIGKLTALNPANRPQTVHSIIPGRIKNWKVKEGQYVAKGDTILELEETKDKYFDPLILTRLSDQLKAKKAGLLAKDLKKDAYQNQIEALQKGLEAKLSMAKNKIVQVKLKVTTDSISYSAEKINFANADNQFYRNKLRFESGNISLTYFQDLETKYNLSKVKLVSTENKFFQSQASLAIAMTDLSGLQAEYAEKINKAISELQSTLSDINEAQASIAKMKNELSNVKVRTNQYVLRAPQSGYVVKALKAGIGETIKEGEAIISVQPENPDMAVEMYVRAMDLPLIEKGRKSRIEFDGWPALQFSGWPNVSVGTFGGVVQVVDRVNNEEGLFRILISPDPEDVPWPQQLRLGSGAKGWVMLKNVRIWYEIWRQFNGFPPNFYSEPENNIKTPKNKVKLK